MVNVFRHLALTVMLLAFLVSCGKEQPDPTPQPDPAPSSITLSSNSFQVAQPGEKLSLTIKAPARPTLTGLPSWITYVDGTFNAYSITVGLTVVANDTYDARSATVTVASSGASSVTFTVSQAAKEKPVDPPTPPSGDNEAWALAKTLGLGWNMGNHFDAYYNWHFVDENGFDWYDYPNETVWGGELATPATFKGVKAAGFTSVRIPVTWLNFIGKAPEYKIDETWLNRVHEVVGFAHAEGLNVIINTHHDENHGDDHWLDIKNASVNSAVNETIKAEIKAVWTQIANKFSDCGDWLIMEGFNELNDGGWGWSADFQSNPSRQCDILNEWNQVFVDAVRAAGGENATRWLGVPTYAANPEFTKYLKIPSDKAGKVMVSVHFYDPYDYTIGDAQYSDWGHTGAVDKKANGGDETHVKDVFSKLNTEYVSKNIPCYIGEFGCSMRAKSDTRAWKFYLYYMEYIVKAAKTYGLPCFLWDNGAKDTGKEQHGYINHGTGAYIGNSKEVVNVIKKAWFTESDGYTLQHVYDSAPKF
ncbi:MAG: cellulase family glycosylhydrolase [Bacteroidales bacterium]|nr:cellulase family glycosylhydrolase [Bacteroidales bacterium]